MPFQLISISTAPPRSAKGFPGLSDPLTRRLTQ